MSTRPSVTHAYELATAEVERLLAAGVQSKTAAWLCAIAHTSQPHRPWPRPREHGSERGYQQHRYDGTDACRPCLDGHAAQERLAVAV